KALPAPGETAAGAEYEAPRTAAEEVLAGIWGDLLRRERVGVHDNFFALGGHSLLATQVVSRLRDRLGVELPVRALFEQPTVAGLAVLLSDHSEGGGEGVAQAPIVTLPRDAEGGGTFPASFAQRRLWFLDQLEPGSAVYNIPLALSIEGESLEGELAAERLAAVFGELARRHETLRTTFTAGTDGPLQVVHPAAEWPFALASIDLSALGDEERRRELTRRVAEESLRPFDLASGPLLRATLVRLAARESALLLTLHHVISDGWSMGVLVRDVTALYAAAVAGRPLREALPPLPVQYADFTVWQNRRLSGETLAREIEHWREKLAGAPPFLELPTDRPRPPVQTFGGRSLPLWLEPGLTSGLSALALATGTTLFMVLLAGFETLLGIYSGAEDLAVGTPIAGRNRAELEELIGFFVNSLVLRADLSGDPSFVDLLGRVREDTLSAYTHQDLPFEKLVEEVNPERSRAHSPIFQVAFALQNAPMGGGGELPGLTMQPLAGGETAAKYDLALVLSEESVGSGGRGGIGGSLDYNVDLFDAPTMVRLLDHWRALLEGVVADSGSRLSALPLLAPGERQQLLYEWSDAAPAGVGETGGTTPVHELFAMQAAQRPDAVALVSGHQVLTYGEFARTSSRMARRLTELGVGPGTLVGLCAERSPELILGVLAILAAGGAYLPLDPAHPMERLAYTLADAGAPILLAEESLHERLPAGTARVVGLHALASQEAAGEVPFPAVRVDPGDLAYVIYTSGSTGRPKGVEVSHANVARLFAVIRQSFAFGQNDVWTLFHSIAFDFSVWELWGALAFGGRLVVVPGETARSTEAFYELLRRERVTV
ncbi:MAG TPA: condensation domain-containing protein, partial [Candidatus Nanopelagicales bacterium]|nr:condensation domain-containing protein [Candidatus Nanopelagicales bacterium]